MSSNVWRSEPYRKSYQWLLENLQPGKARGKAFSSGAIQHSERNTLAAISDTQKHNEELLMYMERIQENYPCLVDVVSEMGCEKEAECLREALPPPSPQAPRHLACASAVESAAQPALPVQHTLAHQVQPGLLQGPPPQLIQQSQSKLLPLPKQELRLLPDEPLKPEAKCQLSYLYPLDTQANGEAVPEVENLRADTRNSPFVFDVSPASSDTSIDSDVKEDVMKKIKIFVLRGKCDDFDVKHIRHTLKKNFKLEIEREYITDDSDDSDEEEKHVQCNKVVKRQVLSDDAITAVKIVIGVDELAMKSQRKEVVARVLESLRWCGTTNLSVRCVDHGSIVIYALIPISDLIRLYHVATHYPGVLAGIGILEISTLGRATVISFRTSPAGPVKEPIHPSLAEFIDDMLPGQAHVITSEPNMHHAVRVLVSKLLVDGEARISKVIKWLEKHTGGDGSSGKPMGDAMSLTGSEGATSPGSLPAGTRRSMIDAADPPSWKCYCGRTAMRLQTKKESANRGRWFHKCATEKKCKFWRWEDQHLHDMRTPSSSQQMHATSRSSSQRPREEMTGGGDDGDRPPKRKPRTCSVCKKPGHDKRTCPLEMRTI